MAGKNVIAALEAKSVETDARITEAQAMLKSLGTELRTIKWMLGILLALIGMLVPVLLGILLYLLPRNPAPIKVSAATAVVEALDHRVRPPTADLEVTDKAAERNARQ